VTSWKKSAFKAIGIDTPIEHDERYRQADEYLRVLYKLWEGSWSDDAIVEDVENDTYINPIKYDRLTIMGSTSIWRRGISWTLLLKEHHSCFRQALLRTLPCSPFNLMCLPINAP
jgi:hypothetical protein